MTHGLDVMKKVIMMREFGSFWKGRNMTPDLYVTKRVIMTRESGSLWKGRI